MRSKTGSTYFRGLADRNRTVGKRFGSYRPLYGVDPPTDGHSRSLCPRFYPLNVHHEAEPWVRWIQQGRSHETMGQSNRS